MKKYKVLKVFSDIHTKQTYKVGQVIELNDSRFEEIEKNLEQFGSGFLEIVKSKKKTTKNDKEEG